MYNNTNKQNNKGNLTSSIRGIINQNYNDSLTNEFANESKSAERTLSNNASSSEFATKDTEQYYDVLDSDIDIQNISSNTFQTDSTDELKEFYDALSVRFSAEDAQDDSVEIDLIQTEIYTSESIDLNEENYASQTEVKDYANTSSTLLASDVPSLTSLKARLFNYLEDISEIGRHSKQEITDFIGSLLKQTKEFFTEMIFNKNEEVDIKITHTPIKVPTIDDFKEEFKNMNNPGIVMLTSEESLGTKEEIIINVSKVNITSNVKLLSYKPIGEEIEPSEQDTASLEPHSGLGQQTAALDLTQEIKNKTREAMKSSAQFIVPSTEESSRAQTAAIETKGQSAPLAR